MRRRIDTGAQHAGRHVDPLAFMSTGGEMGVLIRAHDWQRTSLGAPAGWPQGLKTALRTALTTRHPIFIFWGASHLCFYNDGYRPSLGPEKHPSILGAPGREVFPELWEIIGPQIDMVMRGQGATWHENHLVPSVRHGRLDEVYWTYSYGPIDDDTAPNGVGGVLVVCTETTEQVRGAAALRENQAALQRLNDELEERVAAALAERKVLADIVGGSDAFVQVAGTDFRWIAINEAAAREFERIYGVRPRAGQHMLDLLDGMPAQREAVRAVWQRALDGEAFVETGQFGAPGLVQRHYEMRFSPLLDGDGRRVGAYQFVYDVTDALAARQRLADTEDALRQAQKLETLGQLTGGVAHDFNNLLTPVMAALDFARLELSGDATARELMAVGLQAADRARTLVQRLLAFSRKQQLAPQDVDVALAIDNMVEMGARALGPGVSLRLDVPDGLPAAHVDPDQLVLALLNLAVNARDAMDGTGLLQVRVRESDGRDHDALAAGRYLRIDVDDDGAGMDQATLRRAAEPFFTTKEPGRGTGLGLPAVQGLAVQSGGGFRLDSVQGQGTTATLWLPVVAAGGAPDAPAQPPAAAGEGRAPARGHVLLVDDDDLVRFGAAATLRRAGYRVTEAASGGAALAALEAGAGVDVLVTDQAMPGLSGVDLAARARALRPGLPALLVSGYAELSQAETASVARLAKPYRPGELLDAVAGVLAQPAAD